jgi:hypothetical protein
VQSISQNRQTFTARGAEAASHFFSKSFSNFHAASHSVLLQYTAIRFTAHCATNKRRLENGKQIQDRLSAAQQGQLDERHIGGRARGRDPLPEHASGR